MRHIFLNRIQARQIKGHAPLWGLEMVEALVAIVILTLAIIGPMALAIQTAQYSRVSLARIQASYLADEGLDLMVNYRQSLRVYCASSPLATADCAADYEGGNPSLVSLSKFLDNVGTCRDGESCAIDVDSFLYLPSPSNVDRLIFSPHNNCPTLYTYPDSLAKCSNDDGTGIATQFTRRISIREVEGSKIERTLESAPGSTETLTTGKVVEITSTVCIHAEGEGCNENTSDAIVVKTYVTS